MDRYRSIRRALPPALMQTRPTVTQAMKDNANLHLIPMEWGTLRYETGKNGQNNLVCSSKQGRVYRWARGVWVYNYG